MICNNHHCVRYPEGNDHHANKGCRKACNNPQYVYSRFEEFKEFTCSKHFAKGGISSKPKLNNSQWHIQCKQIKSSLVAVPNTILCPHAVVIKLHYAIPACTTVRHSRDFVIFAMVALFSQEIGFDIWHLRSYYIRYAS